MNNKKKKLHWGKWSFNKQYQNNSMNFNYEGLQSAQRFIGQGLQLQSAIEEILEFSSDQLNDENHYRYSLLTAVFLSELTRLLKEVKNHG